MQYSTPQFIEEEGKIIFFLTFRQFFLLVGGGAICIVLYFTLPFWLFAVLSLPIMILAVAIAFIKIGNESIIKIFLHSIRFLIREKSYIWKKKEMPYPMNTAEPPPSRVREVKKMIDTKR